MTGFDGLLALVLGVGVVRGYATGLLRQLVGLVSFLLALFLASELMRPVGEALTGSLGLSPRLGPLLGFVGVFLAVTLAFAVVTRAMEGVMNALRLGTLNRLGGGALGALRAALAASVLLLPLRFAGVPDAETRAESVLYEPVADLAPTAYNAVRARAPEAEQLRERFRRFVHRSDSLARVDSVRADGN